MTAIYTVDILLARYFLSPFEAGQYAALSVLGKIVFFASSPISSAMFPIISSKYAKNEPCQKTFIFSFLIVFAISLGVSLLYFMFPKIMILMLFGKEYLVSSPFLWQFALFISLYSFSSIFLNYFISISKQRAVYLPLFFLLVQIFLIYLFHQNISSIIIANIASALLLFFGLLIIYFLDGRKKIAFSNCSSL
jgi:O-antigen/teichoic acid export membrane protein